MAGSVVKVADGSGLASTIRQTFLFNGLIHALVGWTGNMVTFNGTAWVAVTVNSNFPDPGFPTSPLQAIVVSGILYCLAYKNSSSSDVYQWDPGTGTWNSIAFPTNPGGGSDNAICGVSFGNVLHVAAYKSSDSTMRILSWNGATWDIVMAATVVTDPQAPQALAEYAGNLYMIDFANNLQLVSGGALTLAANNPGGDPGGSYNPAWKPGFRAENGLLYIPYSKSFANAACLWSWGGSGAMQAATTSIQSNFAGVNRIPRQIVNFGGQIVVPGTNAVGNAHSLSIATPGLALQDLYTDAVLNFSTFDGLMLGGSLYALAGGNRDLYQYIPAVTNVITGILPAFVPGF